MYAVLVNMSVIKDVLSTTICVVEQTLNAIPLTPVSSDVNDFKALSPNHFLLATGTFAYHIYHVQKNLLIIESSFNKLKPMQISCGTDLVKSLCQL